MLKQESFWIYNQLKKFIDNENKISILNLGSSSREFREREQSYINENIFSKIDPSKASVLHSDLKNMDGVDLVGDILNKDFQKKLFEIKFDVVICSNMVEQLEDIDGFIKALLKLIDVNGRIIFTAPYIYPYHKDPIDNLYRPNKEDLIVLFGENMHIEYFEFIKENQNFFQFLIQRPKIFLIFIIRILTPFYKFKDWKCMIKDFRIMFKNFEASCAVVKKIK